MAEEAASACRRLKDAHKKLGQDEEAGTKLGKLLSGIGSLLASEAAVGQVNNQANIHTQILSAACT